VKTVTLPDGRVVDSSSEEYRFYCEVKTILEMPNKSARRCYLYGYVQPASRFERERSIKGVAQQRGQAAADELHAAVMQMWRDSKKQHS
jgi:hypothetical protein